MRRNRRSHCLFGMSLLTIVFSMGLAVRAQTAPARAPTPTPSPTPSLEREFFRNVLKDQKAIWLAPFNLHKDDAKWMVPMGLGTMALITTDRITGDEIAETDRPLNASRIVSYAGSVYAIAGVAGTFYLVGRSRNNSRARETGILSAEAALDSLIVSGALKGITQRVRPRSGEDRSEFFDGGRSFPSGHTIQAFSLATVIANEYPDKRMVQVAAYGVATAVGIARFTGGKHYLSDVLVGSALGCGIGRYVYHTHHQIHTAPADDITKESRWPVIGPQYNRGAHQYGVALTWSF